MKQRFRLLREVAQGRLLRIYGSRFGATLKEKKMKRYMYVYNVGKLIAEGMVPQEATDYIRREVEFPEVEQIPEAKANNVKNEYEGLEDNYELTLFLERWIWMTLLLFFLACCLLGISLSRFRDTCEAETVLT